MVVYIARKTHWQLNEIRSLMPNQLVEIYNEARFQDEVERWERNTNLAALLAAIHNCIPGRRQTFTVKDFYDYHIPTRDGYGREEMDEIDTLAQKHGITI